MENLLILASRICISALFLWAGMSKLIHWKGTIDYMKTKNMPQIALFLPAAILMQLLGGVSLLLGYHTRIGALLLIVFLIPSSIKMHDFWNCSGPERTIEKTMFMKDVAIFGALLLLFATGAGSFAFD